VAARLQFSELNREPRSTILLRRIIVPLVALHVALATISGYRAIVQVYSLRLLAEGHVVRPGSALGFEVTTSARTPVDVELELIQGVRSETLKVKLVKDNVNASQDPRPRRAAESVVLSPVLLSRFHAGPALVRATANGRSQWFRVPPPTVRELSVEISPD
jgi:hypothetical protein